MEADNPLQLPQDDSSREPEPPLTEMEQPFSPSREPAPTSNPRNPPQPPPQDAEDEYDDEEVAEDEDA